MAENSTQAARKEPLSLARKLDILPAAVILIATAIQSALTGIVRGQNAAPSYFLHIAYAIMRKATARLSVAQLQWISPPTTKVYEIWARKAHVKPDIVDLGYGAKGLWIGEKTAKNVLVWYHGGGFCLPANIGAFKFWDGLVRSSQASGKELAVFALSYTLAPQAQYPTQLIQATEALRYIAMEASRSPANIILGGDSCGGNLVFGVLSHIAHPHPAIKELRLSGPLAGVAVIAPWTSLNEEHAKQKVDYSSDLVTPYVGVLWSREYLGSSPRDNCTDPFDAPPRWFEAFPVQPILVVAGGNEIMLPMIEQFVENLKAGFPDVELFVGKREAHVAPIHNLYAGDNKETEQGKKLQSWLRELL